MNQRARAFCFTLNNYSADDERRIRDIPCNYLCYGRERGNNNTPHIQGYIYFASAKTFTAAKRLLGQRCHLEVAKGDPQSNRTYCSKDNDFYETGKLPQQGKRSDIDNVRATLNSGGRMRDVMEVATSYQSAKFGELWLKYCEPARTTKPKVYWFFGATGTGKSKEAKDRWPDAFWTNGTKWWCGYDGHANVIWDDFRCTDCSLKYLLRVIDRYPVRAEIKGSQRQLRFDTICFTAPEHPSKYFVESSEDLKQLLRRIDEIKEYKNYTEVLHRSQG